MVAFKSQTCGIGVTTGYISNVQKFDGHTYMCVKLEFMEGCGIRKSVHSSTGIMNFKVPYYYNNSVFCS